MEGFGHHPRDAWSPEKLGRGRKDPPLEPREGAQPRDFWPQDHERIDSVLSHQFLVICYGCPRK